MPKTKKEEQLLLDYLKKLVTSNPDTPITRDFYRKNKDPNLPAFEEYFGTFTEFKRKAGVEPTRQQQKHLNNLAHVRSLEIYDKANLEKQSFTDKFIRPSNERFKNGVVISDIHDKKCDPFYRRISLEVIKMVSPNDIVIAGDLFDHAEFGRFYNHPEENCVVERKNWVHSYLQDIRNASPEANMTLLEGNHELRFMKYMTERAPHIIPLMDDGGMDVNTFFGLNKFEINYIAKADLSATGTNITKELRKNHVILYDGACAFQHEDKGCVYHLYPGAHGHNHKHIVWPLYIAAHGPCEWHQLGCGHIRNADYCDGEKWSNGFLYFESDTLTKKTVFTYIDCTHDFCRAFGNFYERTSEEKLAYK